MIFSTCIRRDLCHISRFGSVYINKQVNVVREGQNTKTVKDLEVDKISEQDDVDNSDNAVLRRLLRGPRYFDPADISWGTCYNCGEEGHVAVNCRSAKRKKSCFVCGSFEHGAKECQKESLCVRSDWTQNKQKPLIGTA